MWCLFFSLHYFYIVVQLYPLKLLYTAIITKQLIIAVNSTAGLRNQKKVIDTLVKKLLPYHKIFRRLRINNIIILRINAYSFKKISVYMTFYDTFTQVALCATK